VIGSDLFRLEMRLVQVMGNVTCLV
jgi:hypothetical protein